VDIWPDLTTLNGKRIAVESVGSDNQIVAKKLFALSDFNQETKVLPLAGQAAVKALSAKRQKETSASRLITLPAAVMKQIS